MDAIKQYYQLSDIRPSYHKLDKPFYQNSRKKIQFNLLEMDLHYLEEFGIYVSADEVKKITGGSSKIITVLKFDEVS